MRDEWEKVTLGEVANLQTGPFGSQLKAEEYVHDGIPIVMPINITSNGTISMEKIVYASEEKSNTLKKHKLESGDIVFSRRGDLSKIGYITANQSKWLCGTGCLRARPQDHILSSFLYLYLKQKEVTTWLEDNAIGQTMKNVNTDILSKLPVLIPCLEEQEKIAETLSIWDSAIEKTEKLISEKEKMLQWLIIQNFERNDTTKDWIKSKLSDFLKPGDKNPVENTTDYQKITIKLHKNGIEFVNSQKKMADTRPFYIRRAGELIIGKQNYFNGSIALLENKFNGAICSNAIMSFSISESVNPEFLLEAISTEKYLREKSVFANGTGQKELSENVFLNFDVKLPSLKIQNEIMEIINLQKSEISLLKKQLEQYKLQKQGLMQKLLTGEWRVK